MTIIDKNLNTALSLKTSSHFLQSLEWQKFQKSVGKKTWRINDVLVVKERLPLGKSFFYIPFAHRLQCLEVGPLNIEFFKTIKEIAKREKAIFLHLESMFDVQHRTLKNWVKSDKDIQPKKTLILDLTNAGGSEKSEDEIFNNFKKDVRYSIRLAQSRGVAVSFSDNYDPVFYRVVGQAAKRGKFQPFSESYYQKMFEAASEQFQVKLCFAKYKGEVVAASILVIFNKSATYLHSGSSSKHRDVQAPSLLQWEQIKLAKKLGCIQYDFWGIDKNKWPGVTHFKLGFNGRQLIRPQRYDIIFNKFWFKLYQWSKKLLKKS